MQWLTIKTIQVYFSRNSERLDQEQKTNRQKFVALSSLAEGLN